VHWARDAAEANRIVTDLVLRTGTDHVVKVKSMATQEIGLNEALEAAGVRPVETDLAELTTGPATSWCRRSTGPARRSARSSCSTSRASTPI
jgi:L-lactate utilization protein LutB